MDALPQKLLVIFQNVNEWVKFAEAKNAVLLAFAGAAVTVTTTALVTAQAMPFFWQVALSVTTGWIGICAFLCAVSFIPKTNLEKILWLKQKPSEQQRLKKTDNFYFFGDLRKYRPEELLEAINYYYFNNEFTLPHGKECEDIAAQIVVAAQIANMKFTLFTYAIYSLLIALLCMPIFGLLNLAFFRK
ncbi:hypothetical protein IQ266_20960 [filamentous cyanobacterium LEGE 11480]|uniref:Pycsar effector protein domain-containing protein n=1 Tax=Romeriopsis navalis LEGE 11480 TaxID=2777977 RepID=A0A928VUC0_9CYAN|nr:hypothetical protein [Romeriopsis navalis]MBE9032214.1 hypothetical protein [Romeriopsis navalis LEGE 11480]